MPGTMRPVPNRLFMVTAQTTALPSRSSVAKLVEAGSGGSAGLWQAARMQQRTRP